MLLLLKEVGCGENTPKSMVWEHKDSHFAFCLAVSTSLAVEIRGKPLSRAKTGSGFPRSQGT